MTIVLKHYTSETGLTADISLKKDCKAFFLTIAKPITGNPGFSTTVYRNCYSSIAAAKAAMKRKDKTFTEGKKMYKVYSYSHNNSNDITISINMDPAKNITDIECSYTENGQTDDILKYKAGTVDIKTAINGLVSRIECYFNKDYDSILYEDLCIPAQDGIYNALLKISEEY